MSFLHLNHLLAACWMGGALGVPGVASASREAPAVLFLEEDDGSRPGYVAMMGGFRQALEKSLPGTVAVYPENLDLARFSKAQYRDQTHQWFRQKYTGKEIDVLVAFGPASIELAGQFQREFWPAAKILRVSSNPPEQPLREPHVSDLFVHLDAAGTLNAARSLLPEATRLVVVVGAKAAYSGLNEYILSEAAAAAARHGLTLESLAGLPLAETRRRLSQLPRNAIVFYGSISVDGDGRTYTPRDVLVDLARASTAPIFGLSETFMGHGMTGGVVLRMEELGRELAGMTVEALLSPAEHTPASRKSQAHLTVFDWRELRRFGLSQRALPPAAEVRFAPPSLWQNHRTALIGGLTLFLGQSGLITAFMIQLRRRRKAEQKVLLQRDQLAQVGRVSSLGQLAASIAHELSQPLGAILRNAGAAERLLQKENPDLPELRAILADILADDTRASTVIERMHSLLTRHSLDFHPVDLKEVLHQAADLLSYEARRRGIALKVVTTPGLPSVHGDRVHLQQMVINLALNSMDAFEETPGASVTLQAEPDPSSRRIILRIRDNGPGIPDSVRGSLFEPFQTTKPSGMGMGLAISQTIAEAHEGKLEVESSGPGGTCFSCTLHSAPFHAPA